jgi:hypothetical protein
VKRPHIRLDILSATFCYFLPTIVNPHHLLRG